MFKILVFLNLLFCVTSCSDEDPLNVKVVDIKEPCECIDFTKRNEIYNYCIEEFDHDLLSKCAIDHPDLLNVNPESHLGFAKYTYTMEAMDFYSVVGLEFKFYDNSN